VQRTVTKTFRVSKEISDALMEESQRASVSENIVANQVLRKWAVFSRYVERQNIVLLNRRIFSRLVKKMSDSELGEVARELASRLVIDLFDLAGIETSRENLLEYYLKTVLSDCMHWYTYEQKGTTESGNFVLRHDLGSHWSAFLRAFVEATFQGPFQAEMSFRASDDSVFFTYSF